MAVITLVRSCTASIVAVVAVRVAVGVVVVRAVWWCGSGVVLAAIVGLRGVVTGARGPACAVEGLAAGLAALAGG